MVGGRAVVVEVLVLEWLPEGWLVVVVEDGVVWGCLTKLEVSFRADERLLRRRHSAGFVSG
jgi:hypothetical protein